MTSKISAPEKAVATKMKIDRSKKLREEQEADRKKRLEDKQAKDAEKRKAVEEKRKAIEEKRKAMEDKRKDIARGTAAKDKVASGTPSVRSVGKPGGTKPAAPKSTNATDGINKTTLSSASNRTLTTKRTTPGLTASSSASQRGISNGTAAGASKISKPVSFTGSRPLPHSAARKPAASKGVPTSSAPSRIIIKPQGTKVTTRVPLSSSRLVSARASSTAATTASSTTSTAATKQARPLTSARLGTKSASAPSKSETRGGKSSSSATSAIRASKSPALTSPSRTGTSSGRGAAASGSSRVISSSKSTSVGRGPATSTGVRKPLDFTKSPSGVMKSPSRIPKSNTKLTTARSPKAATRVPSKSPTKASGSKPTSTAAKKVDAKKTTRLSSKKEESVKDVDPQMKAANLLVSDVTGVEISAPPTTNEIDKVAGTLIHIGSDETSPCPGGDGAASSEAPLAFTPAEAQRAGEIISLQTSLSKELQSKLPRVGEVLDGSDEAAADDVENVTANQRDILENFNGILKTEEGEKPQQLQEEEREERRKVCVTFSLKSTAVIF